jgi:hypothetical protein
VFHDVHPTGSGHLVQQSAEIVFRVGRGDFLRHLAILAKIGGFNNEAKRRALVEHP